MGTLVLSLFSKVTAGQSGCDFFDRRSGEIVAPTSEAAVELCPCARHPALHRSFRAADNVRRVLVAEAAGGHQRQRFTLWRREGFESALEISHFQFRFLLAWMNLGLGQSGKSRHA